MFSLLVDSLVFGDFAIDVETVGKLEEKGRKCAEMQPKVGEKALIPAANRTILR